MGADDTEPYRINDAADAYRVVNAAERTILSCRDRASAEHYAELLNRAYRAGYKSGYRTGKLAAAKR